MVAELVVHLVVDNEALGPSTVLAHVLVRASHDELREPLGIRVVAHDEGILAAQLEDDGREGLGGRLHDLAPNADAPHEDDLVSPGHQLGTGIGVADRKLHEVGGGSDGFQARLDHPPVVLRGPRRELRDLHDDRVAREDRCYHRVEDVVEGIVPGHNGADDADGHPLHAARLVQVHEPRGAVLRQQAPLAVHRGPAELLQRHRELAHHRVHHRLPRLAARDRSNGLRVLKDETLQHTEELAALREGRLRPPLLSSAGTLQHLPGVLRRARRQLAEVVHRRRVPAGHRGLGLPPLALVVELAPAL
mmetsp:Transcript_17514/g.52683  ORF Transcript_17514/g.52683 Transcript_17514/m.52683 type:complete len:305 (+) Transcript_17514:772-1686(+)